VNPIHAAYSTCPNTTSTTQLPGDRLAMPTFSGDANDQKPGHFLKAFRIAMRQGNVTADQDKINNFGDYLKNGSEAETWFENRKATWATYADLETAFNVRFPSVPKEVITDLDLNSTAGSETTHASLEHAIQSTLAVFATQSSKEDVTKALLDLQMLYGISGSDFKKAKIEHPISFSGAAWAQVSEQFGLEKFRDIPEEPFAKLPLPPSVHEHIMFAAAKWVSVYNEPYRHTTEAARMRILDAVRPPPVPDL
jgi:hypothetical protein